MNRYDDKLKAMDWDVRISSTIRAALAVVDAANTGVLSPAVAKRVYEYLDTPYSYYYGEKEVCLYDRFLSYPTELRTKSGLMNVLGLIELAGGYVNRTLYGGFTPKGVKYGHIRTSNAFYILMGIPMLQEVPVVEGGIVAYSDEYSYEEHEMYLAVGGE